MTDTSKEAVSALCDHLEIDVLTDDDIPPMRHIAKAAWTLRALSAELEFFRARKDAIVQERRNNTKDRRPIFDRLSKFYINDEVLEWLTAPHPQLENERASDLIMKGDVEKVHEIIDRLESDGYL